MGVVFRIEHAQCSCQRIRKVPSPASRLPIWLVTVKARRPDQAAPRLDTRRNKNVVRGTIVPPVGCQLTGTIKNRKTNKRDQERPGLEFIALCCFIQHLLGRRYVIENPAFSDIFRDPESPLCALASLENALDTLTSACVERSWKEKR